MLRFIYIYMIFAGFNIPTLSWAADGLKPFPDFLTRCFTVTMRSANIITDHKGCDLSTHPKNFNVKVRTRTDYSGHRFDDANLSGRDLTDSSFENASLKGANLSETTLDNVNFKNANLTGVNFTDADLTDANLTGAILTGAKFSGDDLDLTGLILGDADIKDVKDLEAYIANNAQANNAQVANVKKVKISRRLARKINTYIKIYKEIHENIEKINNCCEVNDSRISSSFVAQLQIKNQESGKKLYKQYEKYLENGERLLDPLTKESEIQNIGKYEKKTFRDKVGYLVSFKLAAKFSQAKVRAEKNFIRGIENELRRNKRDADYEAKQKAERERIALINNTLVYKEMVAAFEKGFVSHPSNVMVMMKLKVLGKSDQEIFEYLRAGIKSYKSCMSNEVGNRFTNDQLKLMATEYGTNKLEIISLNVKCETAAAQTVARVLQRQ